MATRSHVCTPKKGKAREAQREEVGSATRHVKKKMCEGKKKETVTVRTQEKKKLDVVNGE
jgi:hypothetical protein